MTNQETFDQCVAHLRQQKVPAMEHGRCRYRTLEGKKCAAGYFIPDDQYDPVIEAMSLCTCIGERHDPGNWCFTNNKLGNLECWKEHSPQLIYFLQEAHDTAARGTYPTETGEFLNTLERQLAAVAKNHSLVYSEPGEAA